MKLLPWLILVASAMLSISAAPVTAHAACFSILDDFTSRNTDDFRDLAIYMSPVPKAQDVKRFLPPSQSVSDRVNIDFYYVIFRQPQNRTLTDLFREIRGHFTDFAEGTSKDYDFGPYQKKSDNGAYGQINQNLWASAAPTNALMSFNLDTQYANAQTLVDRGLRFVQFYHPHGDVQVTCHTDTEFIFSTVETVVGHTHPVAGNRGFGIKDLGDGTWMFYSKAVDGQSDAWANKLTTKKVDIFCYGHFFWEPFYRNMQEFLNSNAMPVQKASLGNWGTVWFPFRTGAGIPEQAPCK